MAKAILKTPNGDIELEEEVSNHIERLFKELTEARKEISSLRCELTTLKHKPKRGLLKSIIYGNS